MKFIIMMSLVFTSSATFAANNCAKVSTDVSQCSVVYATYITSVTACTGRTIQLGGAYKYFVMSSVNLQTSWLENDKGIIAGSLKKLVVRDGEKKWELEEFCDATRGAQAAKVTPENEIQKAIDLFLKD